MFPLLLFPSWSVKVKYIIQHTQAKCAHTCTHINDPQTLLLWNASFSRGTVSHLDCMDAVYSSLISRHRFLPLVVPQLVSQSPAGKYQLCLLLNRLAQMLPREEET